MATRRVPVPMALFVLLLWVWPASAQSVLERTPNLTGGWTGGAGVAYFNVVHRFNESGAPERKVTSAPTFLAAYAPVRGALLAVSYATNSEVVARLPNEWELAGRATPWTRPDGTAALAVQAGYNHAARSLDAALEGALGAGPVRLLTSARVFSDAYGTGEPRAALGGGAVVARGAAALAADVVRVLGAPELSTAWGVAVQLAIPTTPHTLSLQATNTSTATLQGSSAGIGRVTYGFEFTIPLTLARYFGPRPAPAVAARGRTAPGVVVVAIRDMAFAGSRIEVEPGTRVRWRNDDPVGHTATSTDGLWDSGILQKGGVYERVFDQPGEFRYRCSPHPFMEATIVVRAAAAGGAR